MLAAALVVFREVFEIVLIIGVIMAATINMPGRNKAIFSGLFLGIIFSIFVAFSANYISNLAEGMGQEITNATILFTAAGFIGWTVIWMQKHAKEISGKFKQLSSEVSAGKSPIYILSIIIALTILREGAEIILFTYGMIAAQHSIVTIATGALIGAAAGLIIGLLLYLSLIKIPLKYFFRVTSYMLIFLIAGMVSQAFGYLIAAGYFANLSNIIWDSSSILSQQSLLGRTLETLVGYSSRPSIIQLIAYISTLTIFALLLKIFNKSEH